MADDLYSIDDIAVELGKASASELSAAQSAQAKMWASDVLSEIAARATLRTLADLDPDILSRVVRVAVAERMSRPQGGATMIEVAVDDARTVRQFSASTASDSLMRDPWWDWLGLSAQENAGSRAFTITPAYDAGSPVRAVSELDYRRRWGGW